MANRLGDLIPDIERAFALEPDGDEIGDLMDLIASSLSLEDPAEILGMILRDLAIKSKWSDFSLLSLFESDLYRAVDLKNNSAYDGMGLGQLRKKVIDSLSVDQMRVLIEWQELAIHEFQESDDFVEVVHDEDMAIMQDVLAWLGGKSTC